MATDTQVGLFLDGVLQDVCDIAPTFQLHDIGGGHLTFTYDFNGLIDEFAFFDGVISPSEIMNMYNVSAAGNEYWSTPKKTVEIKGDKGKKEFVEIVNEDLILLNDYGVNSILVIIGSYIDKNTILSNYDEMRINEMLADLGDELANFIYCNYEKIGMDTEFKKTRYQLMVLGILHSIESTFRRSLKGKTMEDINTSRIFTQSDSLGNRPQQPTKKAFSPFKPSTW